MDEWISVEDKLPKYKSLYIICANMGFIDTSIMLHEMVFVALWDGTNWIGVDDRSPLKYSTVTHWMPLPEPPKEEEYGVQS